MTELMIINGAGELTERRQPASCLTQTQETQKHTTEAVGGPGGPREEALKTDIVPASNRHSSVSPCTGPGGQRTLTSRPRAGNCDASSESCTLASESNFTPSFSLYRFVVS